MICIGQRAWCYDWCKYTTIAEYYCMRNITACTSRSVLEGDEEEGNA